MDINAIFTIITAAIALFSTILLYFTIKKNNELNQKNIFNEVVKQERELRIKLSEYREEIHQRLDKSEDFEEIALDYDTLLFNYYEYLAICLYKALINEKETKLYFKELLIDVKERFDYSLLFKKGYAKKEQYRGIQWL